VTFGERNSVEQVFRSLKLRLASMDKRFPYNASKGSILRWVNAFFTYTTSYNKVNEIVAHTPVY
jgi:transposase